MADHDVDLFVIGAGSGGVRAARIASGHGARVMVAEEYRVGGTCVIRGCVPKKLLVYASRFADEFEDAAGYGWTLGEPTFDWATLIANKDREIARLEAAYTANLERAKVAIVKSRAVLEDAHTVRLVATGETVRAETILIATGAAPHLGADIAGIEHVISSNEAFHLPALPKRVLIQGGGYIAVEFAGIFNGLGSRGDAGLSRRADPARLRQRRARASRDRNGQARHQDRVQADRRCHREGRSRSRRRTLPTGESFVVDCAMFATGRKPNVQGLGLEKAGVTLAKGAIAVDEFSRTSVPNIYAVGDVTDRINLTPVAIREGHAFADTVFGGKPVKVDHTDVPTAVFSEPEVGVIGLTETQAAERYPRVDIYKTSFRPMKATLSGRDTRSFFKLIVDAASDRVLGCHIVGPDAGEMIQLVGIAVKMNATKADFDAVMAVHPTASEELVTLRTKAYTVERQAAE